MKKIFYGLTIFFGILLVASFSIQEIYAQDKDNPIYASHADVQAGQESAEAWGEYQKQLKELQESIDKPSPRQQIANGIRYMDVFCSNDFVLLFKWSSNSQACVKPQSVDKLIERGWGVPKDQTVFLGLLSLCWTDFTIHYSDPSKYKESKIFTTIRDALSETDLSSIFGEYTYRWDHISIWSEPDNEGKTTVTVEGSYMENASELEKEDYRKIIEALQSIDGVTNIQPRGVVCQ